MCIYIELSDGREIADHSAVSKADAVFRAMDNGINYADMLVVGFVSEELGHINTSAVSSVVKI